jgi:hypothetical protein
LQTRYKWKDLGESEETYKDMTFWLKKVPL